ncbi:PilZ domain-containing protein [Actinoplanes sp. HUAS TT8]|uniref:PilZ domain-containing protein n=1 Tax=Actinoplanes sp. HUAS TT8 TaxID=3447453 RepID=UPI003F52131D
MELPEIGSPMFLALGDGVNFRSRLESVDGDTFSVAAPLETSGPTGFLPGYEFEAFWVPPRTRIVMPVLLKDVTDSAPFRWTLFPTAEPVISNRREYARGGAGAPIRLFGDWGPQYLQGRMLDISEGGLRFWVQDAKMFSEGDHMRALVWLGNGEAELKGKVYAVRPAADEPGHHVVLIFKTVDPLAQMIRQYVIAWEISERRKARQKH